MLQDDLNRIRAEATAQLAGASGKKELEELRVRYLGKKGEVTAILKQMGKLSPEERPVVGKLANEVRAAIEEALEARTSALSAAAFEEKLKSEKLDVTLPGRRPVLGHKHPLSLALDELKESFSAWAFRLPKGRKSNTITITLRR